MAQVKNMRYDIMNSDYEKNLKKMAILENNIYHYS